MKQVRFDRCKGVEMRELTDTETQASYGKGPDYFLLKTAIFPISVFLLLFSMKFHAELENYQHDSSQ